MKARRSKARPKAIPRASASALATAAKYWALRLECRAILYREHEFTLPEAVDPLQAAAQRDGLVHAAGQDGVQWAMAKIFHRICQ
jgi:hypothetical protein